MSRLKRSFNLFIIFTLVLFMQIPQTVFANDEKLTLNYLALGDSLAAGTNDQGQIGNGYPEYIKEGIEELTEFEVILDSKGVPGYTTEEVLGDLNDDEFEAAIEEADIITLSAGANDMLQALDIYNVDFGDSEQLADLNQKANETIELIAENTGTILGIINDLNPNAEVYVMGYYNALPYMGDETVQPIIIDLINGLNHGIQTGTEMLDATFVPTFQEFEDRYEELLPNPDNIHPNESGYQMIAAQFIPVIIQDFGHGDFMFGEGEPGDLEDNPSYYLDVTTLDLYQMLGGLWQLIGNLDELNILYGNGLPQKDEGSTGQYYIDLDAKYLYVKQDLFWKGSLDLNSMEPIEDPIYPGFIVVGDEQVNAIQDNGELVIPLDEDVEENEVILTAQQIASLVEKRATLTLHQEGVTLNIPATILSKAKNTGSIKVKQLGETDESLSSVNGFSILVDGEKVRNFEEEVGMSFKINETEVINPDQVAVFNLNNETNKWELIGGDYQEGWVSATINHIGKFVVYEVAVELDEDNDEIVPPEKNLPMNPLKEEELIDSKGNEPTDKTTNKETEPAVKTEISGLGGEKLPDTATNTYNYLLAGVLFIVIGSGLYMYGRRMA